MQSVKILSFITLKPVSGGAMHRYENVVAGSTPGRGVAL